VSARRSPEASTERRTCSRRSSTARGPQRGGKRAVREYTTGGFGAGVMSLAGNKAKPVLGPVALRAEPLPVAAKVGLGVLALLAVAAIVLLVAALV
jgi:hypothetical protein